MLVYGIRCPVTILPSLPEGTQADYYMEYGLLVFPSYTKPTAIRSSFIPMAELTSEFTDLCQKVIECKFNEAIAMDSEHPFITEGEVDAVDSVRQEYPQFDVGWFHVPSVRV